MLSFEICAQKKGSSIKENFGISKLITWLYPDGILPIIAQFFKPVADSKGRDRKCLAWHPEARTPSNPSSVATRHTSE
jgi:hypothetical protein